MRQTVVQEARSIRFGSGRFEVGEDTESLVDLGAMRDIQFEELWDRVRVMSDNAGTVNVGIRNHRAALQGNLMEIDLENLALIRGGLDEYDQEAGTLEDDVDQVIASGKWALGTFLRIENQNGDGSEITINSVKGNSTPYVLDTDYLKIKDEKGDWGILVLDTETTDLSHHLTINYDYTPNAHKTFSSGGRIQISPRVVRVTNFDEEEKKFQITVWKAEVENGITLEFPADDDEDPAMTEIRLEGEVDVSRDVGSQLFEILDEQSA